jgi:hypothetical protein
MAKDDRSLLLEDVKIIFRNFAGLEGPYNRAGDRNFCVLLDDETAKQLNDDGWNVKVLKARDEDEEEQPYLPVAVNFKGRPPRVVMVTSRGRTTLHENEVELLDWADIRTVDLILNPYDWTVNGKSGTKAYLQSLFATIEEDALELKYRDVDDTRLGNNDE